MITALAFSLIVAVVVSGISTLSVQHFSRTSLEADNAAAIFLADAGINKELNFITANQLNSPPAHYAYNSTEYTGTISGVTGSYKVWVTNDPDNGAAWIPPNNMIIHSIGTITTSSGTISRKAIARGRRQSIFDAFATFGIDSVNFNGSGSIVNGDIGTNDRMIVVDALSNVPDPWTINLMGGAADMSPAQQSGASNIVTAPNPLNFPTVDQIIVRPSPVGVGSTGWTWLTANTGNGANAVPTNRSNGQIRTFAASGGDLSPGGTRLVSSLPTTGNPPNWNTNKVTIASADIGKLTSANVYKLASGAVCASTATGATLVGGRFAMILPTTYQATGADGVTRWYGDYYFSDIDTGGSSGNCIIVDNGGLTNGNPGTIRIWMDNISGNANDDTINVNVYFTAADSSTFRLYYNKCATITVGGNSTYWGGFYGVCGKTCTNKQATINVGGGSTINGSVLADNITISGGSRINFPANIIDNPADFSLWFGFKDEWKEVAAGSGSVFYDGTNK